VRFREPELRSFLRFALTHLSDIRNYQNTQLKRLIHYSYRKTPFYRKWFDSYSIHPGDIRNITDLQKIPPIAKEVLRRSDLSSRISSDYQEKKLCHFMTTGSSGVPFQVMKSPVENWMFRLIRLRVMRRYGYRPFHKVLRIGRQQPDLLVRKALACLGLYRTKVVPMVLPPKVIAREILKENPDVIVGLPAVIAQVALEIEKNESQTEVELVICGGEMLTTGLRRQIEKVFGRVVNAYASIEAQHSIAVECGKQLNMHAVNSGVVLEVLRENGQPAEEGQTGEIVITSLLSFSMPIIRYRMGDLAEVGQKSCPCGAPGPVVRKIQGRRSDFFYLPDGRQVLAIYAAHKIQELADWILQYELVQESHQQVQLKAVTTYTPSDDQVTELKKTVEECFESELRVNIRLVQSLESGPGGKYRVIRTMLGSPYDLVD